MCSPLFLNVMSYGALLNVFANGLSSLVGTKMQQEENQKNRDFNAQEAQKARDYNTWLLKNESQLKVADTRAAGLSPAFMNGSLMASTPTPSSSPTSSGSVSPYIVSPTDISNAMLTSSQMRKTDAEAEALEIDNKRKKAEDARYNWRYYEPNTDVEITDLAKWMQEHPNESPDMVRLAENSDGAKGRFDANRAITQFRKEVSDINVSLVRNKLDEMVYNGQIKDPLVVLALQRMPDQLYKKCLAETKNYLSMSKYYDSASGKLDSEKLLIDLEKQLKEDNNIMPYVDKAFSDDFSMKDFVKVFLLTLMGVAGRVSLHN